MGDISHPMVTFYKCWAWLGSIGLVFGIISQAVAAPSAEPGPKSQTTATSVPRDAHAYQASYTTFPSHRFRAAPRWHEAPELSVHFGLIQPLLLGGFNAAMDLRWGPILATYSHGQGLDYSARDGIGLTGSDREAGLELRSPWTTGGGIGVVLVDELWALVDFKAHRYEATLADDHAAYTTVSIGGELGYRLFAWRGLFVQTMVRYWPNVYTSLPEGQVKLGNHTHQATNLNFFVNLAAGWAFEI